jgi:hypothetical protein
MAKIVCKILGVLFFVIGIVGLVIGEDAHRYHALVHLATGLIALYFGFAGSLSSARGVCLALGVFYLLGLGILGLVSWLTGNPAMSHMWNPGPFDLNVGAHGFHTLISAIFLAGGLFTRGGDSQSSIGA